MSRKHPSSIKGKAFPETTFGRGDTGNKKPLDRSRG
jgi:hypothetical protein